MLHYDAIVGLQKAFDDNWRDWCLGGPKPGGWTRVGEAIPYQSFRLGRSRRMNLKPMEVLAKNFPEVSRWHIDFLLQQRESGLYFDEYLFPRMSKIEAVERAERFLALHQDMKDHGFSQLCPVHVAEMHWPVPYFRFDGCHRAASAYVLGIPEIPAVVFSINELV